jgi:hypothetical protein
MRASTAVLVVTWLLSLGMGGIARAQEPKAAAPPPAVDPKADEALKRMGAALANAKSFTFKSHSTVDQALDNGQAVQTARNQQVAVRRPNGVAAVVDGDLEELNFWYDGKKVTIVNRRANTVGETDAPGNIDAMFDMLAEKFGLVVPLADLLFGDPYKTLMAGARSGTYIGTGYVFETKCDHLAFRQPGVDWQVWIEQGANPVPRKVVITYKELPARPQYTSYLSDWNLNADVKDEQFTPKIPQGAKKVEFGPAAPAAVPAGAKP